MRTDASADRVVQTPIDRAMRLLVEGGRGRGQIRLSADTPWRSRPALERALDGWTEGGASLYGRSQAVGRAVGPDRVRSWLQLILRSAGRIESVLAWRSHGLQIRLYQSFYYAI